MLRFRSLVLALVAAAAALALVQRRRSREFVDVEFEDGSAIRFDSGREARDLLDDARAILDLVA